MLLYEDLIFRLQAGHLLDGGIPLPSLVVVSFCMGVLTEIKKKCVKACLPILFLKQSGKQLLTLVGKLCCLEMAQALHCSVFADLLPRMRT